MKQLVPTSIDEYIAEHKAEDVVSGRVVEMSGLQPVVELGEGIRAQCRVSTSTATKPVAAESTSEGKADLSSLSSLLSARWKGNASPATAKAEGLAEGQIRSFRIVRLDPEAKKIQVELA
jgi:small subunit ribosomal protein S1